MNRSSLSPTLFSLMGLPLLTASVVVVMLTMENESEAAQYAVVLPLAYLIGSVPWGYILLRWRRGVDIRKFGSGRTGVTNVLRTGGGKIAAIALALDLSKGIVAALLARIVIGHGIPEVAAGTLALIGHNWPVFLQFRGGRGIATGLGGLTVMAPIPAAIGALVFVPTALLSRYVSLGSIIGVTTACLATLALGLAGTYSSSYILYAMVGSGIIIWQHRDNIQRIRDGTERRLGQPANQIV